MDRLLVNLVEDIPTVTRCWMSGILVVSILQTANLVNATTFIYTYDLCFKRRQFSRLFFSLFNYGQLNWSTIINMYLVVSHLGALERNLVTNKRKLFIIMGCLLVIITGMSRYFPVMNSIAIIMHDNMIYYRNKCNTALPVDDEDNNGWFLIDPIMLTLFSNLVNYFNYGLNLGTVLMTFIPGHILFYVEKVFYRMYKKPINRGLMRVRRAFRI